MFNNKIGLLPEPHQLPSSLDSWVPGSAGLGGLMQLDNIHIHDDTDQTYIAMGATFGYVVRNSGGEKVYMALDYYDISNVLDGPLSIRVYDSLKQECFRITRDEVCCPMCCLQFLLFGFCCCSGKDARIETPNGQILGYIKPNCDRTKFTCTDEKDNPIIEIKGHSKCCCSLICRGLCGSANDLIVSYLDDFNQPQKIERKKVANMRLDTLLQNIPPSLPMNSRAVLLGAMFYIKYASPFSEVKAGGGRRHGHHRMHHTRSRRH